MKAGIALAVTIVSTVACAPGAVRIEAKVMCPGSPAGQDTVGVTFSENTAQPNVTETTSYDDVESPETARAFRLLSRRHAHLVLTAQPNDTARCTARAIAAMRAGGLDPEVAAAPSLTH